MVTITIPRKEYQNLVGKALRYEYLRQLLEEDIFASPPTQNYREVIRGFKESGLYSQQFLKSLAMGLKRSSHFRER